MFERWLPSAVRVYRLYVFSVLLFWIAAYTVCNSGLSFTANWSFVLLRIEDVTLASCALGSLLGIGMLVGCGCQRISAPAMLADYTLVAIVLTALSVFLLPAIASTGYR